MVWDTWSRDGGMVWDRDAGESRAGAGDDATDHLGVNVDLILSTLGDREELTDMAQRSPGITCWNLTAMGVALFDLGSDGVFEADEIRGDEAES